MIEHETLAEPLQTELEIVYQDEYFVAVNKPAGMLVHRSWLDKHETQFVMQTLRDQIGQHVYPLHRLDRPTSGVLVFALSSDVASQVMPMFAEHKMEKTYHAIVRGWIEEAGVLDYPLKVELDKIADKFASQEKAAQEAVTAYLPLARVEVPYSTGKFPTTRYCLMQMKPKTGRKHQLRRHMAHLRHPIVGDTSHGDGKHNKLYRTEFDSHRLLLHASELRFVHPFTEQEIVMKASIDNTWQQLFARFGWDESLVK
ncbi:tRNA pseudouridine(65) synthase TruC [Vibrio sp. CAU 1672]|uniref:tRNA pseudouridine(65) synthase TruC n=1 Tax=Vibrio sp. CAU 1672 TaxID=3032594 RepID=UPI0023DA9810|nr:tRNA pseudouridine(65) synthase TruC [Vibrio sp. CAU 1672]MDF2155545.1 tRNA pseudouridine(65) synthase TruC [Vibrio sp. CAU 1672]